MWNGDYRFLLKQLILKDFRVRYRNMSFGILWSLLNPLVMLVVYSFVFTKIFTSTTNHFAVFLLCGIIPFNFFAIVWSAGTTSVVDNSHLLKRLAIPREMFPIASLLSNCIHLAIQIGLLLIFVVASGLALNIYWLYLPVIWILEILALGGLTLLSAAANVFVRDTRYLVESATIVLFWLVPVFYPFSMIPSEFKDIYQYNPLAAIILAMRDVVLEAHAPSGILLIKLTLVSVVSLVLGSLVFRQLKPRFYSHI